MKRISGGIEYELTRKAVKNLNLRLRPDGSVAVSIPRRVTLAEADRFVEQHAPRIRQARQRLDHRPGYLQLPEGYANGDLFWLFGAPYRLQLGTPGAITLREGQLFLPQAAPLSARDPQLLRWLASQLEPVVAGQIDRLLPSLARFCPRQPGKIQLRWMVSRWGSLEASTRFRAPSFMPFSLLVTYQIFSASAATQSIKMPGYTPESTQFRRISISLLSVFMA